MSNRLQSRGERNSFWIAVHQWEATMHKFPRASARSSEHAYAAASSKRIVRCRFCLFAVDKIWTALLQLKSQPERSHPYLMPLKFTDSGCENCPFFNMDQDNDRVLECTTPSFAGIIASMEPTGSWAARWQRISKCAPGCYALSVTGVLPEEMQAICEYNNVRYVPRN